jgi:hypothetical protein
VRVPLAANKYAQGHQALTFYEDLLLRIRAVPGVQSAAGIWPLPLGGDSGSLIREREDKCHGGNARCESWLFSDVGNSAASRA